MDSSLKQRLLGAAVLVALAVIFLPMLLKGPAPDSGISDLSLRVPETPAGTGTIELPLMADEPGPSSALEEDATGSTPVGDEGAPADDATVLPASVASGQYVVHYATFATQPEADEMARQLQNREFPAFTQGTTFNTRPAVAVRIGPYGQRAEAETVRVRASQVRGDVRPLVLVLDADDAAPRPASPSPAVQQPPPAGYCNRFCGAGWRIQQHHQCNRPAGAAA